MDTTTAQGRLVFNIFAYLAEFECELVRERTQAGLSAARARGRLGGRPKGLSPKAGSTSRAAATLYREGDLHSKTLVQLKRLVELVSDDNGKGQKREYADGALPDARVRGGLPSWAEAGDSGDHRRRTIKAARRPGAKSHPPWLQHAGTIAAAQYTAGGNPFLPEWTASARTNGRDTQRAAEDRDPAVAGRSRLLSPNVS